MRRTDYYFYEISDIGHGHTGAFECAVYEDGTAIFSEKGTPPVRCYANFYVNGHHPRAELIDRAAAVLKCVPKDTPHHPARLVIGRKRPISPEDK